MTPVTISFLGNHLWQSTLFAVAIWLLMLALRKNRAAVRYGLWLAASLKFLLPFSLLVSVGSLIPLRTAPLPAPLELSRAVEQITQPFALPAASVPVVAATASWNPTPILLLGVWVCGFAMSAAVWFRCWRRFRAAVQGATPLDLDLPIPVMTSAGSLEPGVFGVHRPILLLPEGITGRLSAEQLQLILAHELCHVQRRDNLTAAIHMVVESIFWFHPLVWWIGARLVEERERACDEQVVLQGGEPDVYAEGILSVCKFYLQSPLTCASGVTGANLKKRIEAIVSNRIAPRLTAARKILLTVAGIAALAAPMLLGFWRAPLSRAQSQAKLAFAVASIKRTDPGALAGGPLPLAPGVTPGGGIRSHVPLFNLICWAYRIDGSQLSGGPAWVRNDRYSIEAKPDLTEERDDVATSGEERTNRARERVRALLAERFKLAIRTESKEADVYVLSVARGGHKLTSDAEGRSSVRFLGDAIESTGAPISFLTVSLTQMLRRPVLDETGVDGRFKYRLEFRPEDETRRALALAGEPVADNDTRPSIFTALRNQLGLELQSRKGPIPSLVIERIERPTEN